MNTRVIILPAAVAALQAFALTEVVWKTETDGSGKTSNVSGVLTDAESWAGGVAPVAGTNMGRIKASDLGYTVTLPSATVCWPFSFAVPKSGTATLDATGRTYVMAAGQDNTKPDQPFKAMRTDFSNHCLNYQSYAAMNTGEPIVRFDDAVMTATKTNGSLRLAVSRGLVDFLYPSGDGTTRVKHDCQMGHNCGEFTKADFVVENGGRWRMYNIYAGLTGTEGGSLTVDGDSSELYVCDAIYLPSSGNDSTLRELVVTNGGLLETGGSLLLNNIQGGTKVRVRVTDGGTFKVGNAVKQANAGTAEIDVSDRGKFSFNVNDTVFGTVADAQLLFNVHDEGTLEMRGTVFWPNSAYAKRPANGWVDLKLRDGAWNVLPGAIFNLSQDMTNLVSGTVFNGGTVNFGRYESSPAHTNLVDFTGIDFTSTNKVLVGNYSPAHLILGDGTYRFSGTFDLAKDGGSGSVLEIREGADVVFASMSEAQFAHGGTATLKIAGGDVTFTNCPLLGSTQPLAVEMSGGAFTMVDTLRLGYNKDCTMTLSGGTVTAGKLQIGYYPNATETSLAVTGGEIDSGSEAVLADGGNRRCVLALNGGVLKAKTVHGWNGSPAHKTGATGWARVEGDGGTLRAKSAQTDWFYDLDEIVVGAKGLILESDYDVGLGSKAPIADQSDAADAGLLVYAGSGVKTFKGSASNGYTAVAGGTLLVASTATLDTRLAVTNGTSFSLAGDATSVTLRGLTLGDDTTTGTLVLDPGDTIRITESLSLPNGRIAFTSTPADSAYDILVVDKTVAVSAATEAAWERMLIAAGHADGKSHVFSKTTDASGNTVFRLTVAPAVSLTDVSTWKGPGETWETAANWDGGVPGALSVATFDSASAPKAVTLATDTTVGAVRFAEGGYAVTGGGSVFFTDSGNAAIRAEKGTSTLDVAAVSRFALPVDVAAGSELEISGPAALGGLTKTGDGRLALSHADNSFALGIGVSAGTLAVTNASALGTDPVTLSGPGTLAVSAETREELPSVVVNAGDKVPTGIRTEGDVVLRGFTPTTGDLVKYGTGRLTFASETDLTLVSGDANHGRNVSKAVLPLNLGGGTLPTVTDWYGNINIVEGELLLKGPDGAFPTYTMNRDWNVGLCVSGTVPAVVTLDHAKMVANSTHIHLGHALNPHHETADTVYLNVTNGAYMSADTLIALAGRGGSIDFSKDPEGYVRAVMRVDDASTLETTYLLSLNQTWRGSVQMSVASGSKVLAKIGDGLEYMYPAAMEFTGQSVLAATCVEDVCTPTKFRIKAGGCGTMTFRDGSRLYLNSFDHQREGAFSFIFDGGIWNAGDADVTWRFRYGDRSGIVTQGDGLTVEVPSGRTHAFHAPITGEGAVVKSGAGALSFLRAGGYDNATGATEVDFDDPVTARFTGGLDVREGTVTFASGAVSNGLNAVAVASGASVDFGGNTLSGVRLSGAGSVANATFSQLVIDATASTDWTLVPVALGTCAVSGRVRVDYGRTEANPLPQAWPDSIVVATYSGVAPDVSKWRLVNTGLRGVHGVFTTEDGVVRMHPKRGGIVLILR